MKNKHHHKLLTGLTGCERICSRPTLSIVAAAVGCSWIMLWVCVGAARAEGVSVMSAIRGVVRPARQATISTDGALRAIELPYREGARFKNGDTLALFDCRRQKADLAAAVASRREAILTMESNIELDRFRAVGKNDVEISRARADKASADVTGLETRLDECRLVAPFDGRITELSLRTYERTVPQRPFMSIIDDSALEIELIAASAMLSRLTPGTRFSFRLDELGGRTVDAEVAHLGASVDPVSKTIKIIGLVKVHDPQILSGMSGTATFSGEAKP
jgi:membrane fusion protein, multidrug efflux system